VQISTQRNTAVWRQRQNGHRAGRLLAVGAICDCATRIEAAKIGSVGLQIIRDWVVRFNVQGLEGLLDDKSPRHPSKLDDFQC